uniref:AbiEi antitoxin C-terminal domain-containing protein n=1 Tax=termite gut metagenome TaxID=433724 RepID=S0DEF1_9ZZZZ
MNGLRENIIRQISDMEAGRVFTYKDLDFPTEKFGNVTHILFEKSRAGELIRLERGAFYKPKISSLGLGEMPLYEYEKLNYISGKLNGYVTGLLAYNSMGVTEQVPSVIAIATKKYTRPFVFQNLKIETVTAYVDIDKYRQEDIEYLRFLDAVKDIKKIPARTQQEVYDYVKHKYLETYSSEIQGKLVSLAKEYPPRVRKVLSDMFLDLGKKGMSDELISTVYPTTRFELNYLPAYKQ